MGKLVQEMLNQRMVQTQSYIDSYKEKIAYAEKELQTFLTQLQEFEAEMKEYKEALAQIQ